MRDKVLHFGYMDNLSGMPTRKKRINVTIDEDLAKFIELKANRDDISQSQVLIDAVKEKMEFEEDLLLSDLADRRRKETKKWYDHDSVWK